MSISKIILQGNRKEIMHKILGNRDAEVFFLKVKASVPILVYLLNNTKIKKLVMIPSIRRLLSKKIINALKKSGVKIEVKENKVGRPELDEKKIREIRNIIWKRGKDKDKIKKLGISKRTYYYYKKKLKIEKQ